MGLLDAFIAGFGLSMDAFAVSIGKGLSQKKIIIKNMILIAFFFGFFQFAMPVIGYFFCKQFSSYIESCDHWIAFALLVFLGSKMIFECLKEDDKTFKVKSSTSQENANKQEISKDEKNNISDSENLEIKTSKNKTEKEVIESKSNKSNAEELEKLSIKELFLLAFATSIDALITGVTFAFGNGNIFISAGIIGIITFVLSCVGFLIGNYFGSKFKKVAEILGGVVLILLGVKFLLEGYGIIDLGF